MTRAARAVLILLAFAIMAIGVRFAMEQRAGPAVGLPPAIGDELEIDPMVRELVRTHRDVAIEQPNDSAARLALAQALHANGLLEQAVATYRQAIELNSSNARAWYGLARAHERLGEIEPSLHAIDRAIDIDRAQPFLHWRRGMRLLDLGRLDEAQRAFQAAVDLAPHDIAARVGLARVHMLNHDDLDAERLLVEVLSEQPDHPASAYVRQLLGIARRNLGRPDAAAAQLAHATGQFREWDDPWSDDIQALQTGYQASISQARQLLASGEIVPAIDLLHRVLHHKPDDVGALNYLSMAHFRRGDTQDGFQLLQRALAADPDNSATHLNLSRAYQAVHEAQQALEHAQRAVELNPASEEACQQLVQLLLSEGRTNDAAAALEAGMHRGIMSIDARVTLGRIQLHLQRWPEAQRNFEDALRADPEHAGAHLGLARALAEQGQVDRALKHLQRAEQIDPRHAQLAETAARIELIRSSGATSGGPG